MQSAFGVDHGEVEKAFWGSAARAAKKAPPPPPPPQGPPVGARVKGKLNQLGSSHISLKGIGRGVGAGVRRAGQTMEKYPGTTGTAVVGGGGAAGYKYLSERQPKSKKKKS